MGSSLVVSVSDVWKRFRLYHERNYSIKEAILRRKRVNFEEFWALKGVSFNVRKGETLGIIGENGSGKSTLLKLLTRILKPNQGQINMEGKVSALLELGAGFHPELSGRENIYLNGAILGFSKKEIDKKFVEMVSFAELERFIDTPVKNYSSGMYVRLGFALAINVDPDVLLVDEVLAVGDESFQNKCLEKMYELKAKNKTIIFVSHALDYVKTFCDKAIWLDEGIVKKQGPARKVVDSYVASVYTQHELKVQASKGDREPKNRFGSGEVLIEEVEVLDEKSSPKTFFNTGEKMVVRMKYNATEKIHKPVFGVAIHTRDGIHCNGTNTKFYDNIPDYIQGQGIVEYVVEHLPLLKGDYELTVAVYDYACLHPYDHHERSYPFKVTPGNINDLGEFFIPCTWRIGQFTLKTN